MAERLPTTGAVHRLHPLRLGTVDVPRSVVHAGAGPESWTVPLVAYLVLPDDGGAPLLVDNGFDVDVIPRIPTPHTLTVTALEEALARHGLGYDSFETVVNTHLHADHAGMNKAFDLAGIVVQRAEYDYARSATGAASHGYRPRSSFAEVPEERFRFVEGDVELVPGVVLLHTPGHTPGHQAVAVHTRSGWVVVTGDACDDEQVWAGAQGPGIADDRARFDHSLAELHACGGTPLWPHDLDFATSRMQEAY